MFIPRALLAGVPIFEKRVILIITVVEVRIDLLFLVQPDESSSNQLLMLSFVGLLKCVSRLDFSRLVDSTWPRRSHLPIPYSKQFRDDVTGRTFGSRMKELGSSGV